MDFLTTATPIAAIAISCFLALFGVGVVLVVSSYSARTLPARLENRVQELDATVSVIEQNAIELRGQWATTIENLEALETSIEKKRRQLAASASKAKRSQEAIEEIEQPPQAYDPQQQLIALRSQIYGNRQ